MLSRIQALASFLIVPALLLFAGSAAAQDVSPRCEAAMDRAAGHYSKCLLSADASYARHKNTNKLANRQARCETRFDRRTSRAIHRHGADACPSSDLVAAMADRTVTYAEGAATEAGGTPAPSLLFVQNGTGGTLSDTTLTLTDVNAETGYFGDRPYREAGHMSTEAFISMWSAGDDSFSVDPPNADLACTVNGQVVNYVVELSSPSMVGDDLSYAATHVGYPFVLSGTIACDGGAYLFIDSIFGKAWDDMKAAWAFCKSSTLLEVGCVALVPVLVGVYVVLGPAATPVLEVVAEAATSLPEATELFEEVKAIGLAFKESGNVMEMEAAVEALSEKFSISNSAIEEIAEWISQL